MLPNVQLGLEVAGWVNEHILEPVRPVIEAARGAYRGAQEVLRGGSGADVARAVDPEKERLRTEERGGWLTAFGVGLGVVLLLAVVSRRRR